MLDLKDIKERLAEMRRLRALHVAAVAKTAKTGVEIMQADEPGGYEVDVSALIAEVERLRALVAEMAPHAVEGAYEYGELDLVDKFSPYAGPPYSDS